jgi:transposase-like protein
MTRKYASFTKEFKLETLKLAETTELTISQFARNLGIRRNLIYKWQKQMANKKDKAFKNTASKNDVNKNVVSESELLAENKRLKKELKLAAMENEILKKAEAYFKSEKT